MKVFNHPFKRDASQPMPSRTPRLLLRALAMLLRYPDAGVRSNLPGLDDIIRCDSYLPTPRREELLALISELQHSDPYLVEARYVETFDRGRNTSLHMFEHVHGDSRDRGQAMIDLLQTYEAAGFYLGEGELPDHLCVALEFASTQPEALAKAFLDEFAHILTLIFSALLKRESTYASLVAAILELAGQSVAAVAVPVDELVDDSWIEPEPFNGCSSEGQASPSGHLPASPQPLHFIEKSRLRGGPDQPANRGSGASLQGVRP